MLDNACLIGDSHLATYTPCTDTSSREQLFPSMVPVTLRILEHYPLSRKPQKSVAENQIWENA